MNLLAGDIGGTKTWLQVSHLVEGKNELLFQWRYPSDDYATFDELLADFLARLAEQNIAPPPVAAIGVAGPVEQGSAEHQRAKVTNLPWELDSQALAERFDLQAVRLINDFQAVGYGIDALAEDEFVVLQSGKGSSATSARAPRVLIGAGTGLGQGILVWRDGDDEGIYEVLSSEGGHADFAPGNTEQRELMSFLAAEQARVSVEDVLSGRGLVNIYRYLAARNPAQVSVELQHAMKQGDAAAAISEQGLTGKSALASHALDLFVSIYGTQAGNLALTCVARGGVYIAGGIAPKIHTRLQQGGFVTAFCDKGPMSALMKEIPVRVILNPQVGLQGAAMVASRL
jgi:glucokinase